MSQPAPTPADALDLLAPALSPALVPRETLSAVRLMAGALAPIPRCGLEARLGEAQQVDVQQWVKPDDGEPRLLRDHLRRTSGWNRGWEGLDDFLVQWEDASSWLRGVVDELWLELDQPDEATRQAPPAQLSLIAGLGVEWADARDRFPTAAAVLDVLCGPEAWRPWRAAARGCFEASPPGVVASHIGVMLGRSAAGLRINLKRLRPDALPDLLTQVGWQPTSNATRNRAAIDEATTLMGRLDGLVERVTVALDVTTIVHPRLGFECHFTEQPPDDPRWEAFLGELVAAGWCTPAKRDALLDWPGLTTPANGPPHWQAELVHAGLLAPPDHFTCLSREVGHVKVVYDPHRPIAAKAYFGFFHDWLRPESHPGSPGAAGNWTGASAKCGGGRGQRRSTPDALVAALERGTEFLLASRTRTGWWRDYTGRGPEATKWWASWSDEWATAFVATALAAVPDPRAGQAARRAWSLLAARRLPTEGWGWHRWMAVDADSTAWGLRLASALDLSESTRAQHARRVLEAYFVSDGGLTSYEDHVCRLHPEKPLVVSPGPGWRRTSHPCVTAGAATLEDERPRDFLRRTQRDDGSWSAYWWEDDEYTTALAAEALAATGDPDDAGRVSAAIGWASERPGPNGAVRSAARGADSGFATAWCVRILALADDAAAFARPVAWLIAQQGPDGAWPASAWLLGTRSRSANLDESAAPLTTLDEGIVTTATVISALAAVSPHLPVRSSERRHMPTGVPA